MQYKNQEKTHIIDGGLTIPCVEGNYYFQIIKYGQGSVGDDNYIAPTIDDVAEYELPIVADDVIIAQGIDALSNIVEAAYTDKNWKASEYNAKKTEAEYILALDGADIDPEKCRLIYAEAIEKEKIIQILAAEIMAKVKAYEAMVNGERQTEGLLKTAIEAAATQAEKLAAADAIIAAFKDQVAGG